ncbi:MAG: HEAT repeat domain-containing protein [Bryobacteraceae bacterium]|nr:HEAT repeat domain-containing protein [Bryobacteraceae bacterium]
MQQSTPPAAKPEVEKPKPPTPPAELQEREIATMDAAALIRILTDAGSPEFQKAKACQRAGELGAVEAVPAMAALLKDERLNTYARYGLEPISHPSADEALRSALTQLKGNLLIGVIASIGKRRDAKATPALAKMMYAGDANVASAAASALGQIGDAAAAKELQAALKKTQGLTKMAVADGLLACAEHLLAEGNREQALGLYVFLSAPELPRPARLGAMAAIIREETRVGRPR